MIALAAAGCAKKSKPAAAPAAQSAPAPTGASEADQDKAEPQTKGDPCDGGETKSK